MVGEAGGVLLQGLGIDPLHRFRHPQVDPLPAGQGKVGDQGLADQLVDEGEARKVPGFIQAVSLEDPTGNVTGFVVCVAETHDAAVKAAKALRVEWDKGPNKDVDSLALAKAAEKLVENRLEKFGSMGEFIE